MKILYISNIFTKPQEPGPARPYVEASFLAKNGHCLTVITNQRHYLTDEVLPAAKGKFFYHEIQDGLQIIRVATTPGRRLSLLHRILNYASFALMAFLAGLKIGPVDISYVRTPPILIPVIGHLLAVLKKAQFVLYIGDFHPQEAIELGLIRNPWVISLWDSMENFYRRKAALIVTPIPRIKRWLTERGIAAEKICVSTNAYDDNTGLVAELPRDTIHALEQLDNKFLVMYTGSIGLAHPLEILLDAAQLLKDVHPQIHFILVGQGDKLPRLKKLAQTKKLTNVHFFNPVPRDCVPNLLRWAHAVVHLVPAGDLHSYNLPNKTFEYLGSGKPFVFSGTGYIAEIIKAAGCGIVVDPENPQALAEALVFLQTHPSDAQEMGRRGRSYVLQHFSRDKIMTEFLQQLENLCPDAPQKRNTKA